MLRQSSCREGKTELVVPSSSLTSKVPPRDPAFFNPLGVLKRDVMVALVAGYSRGIVSEISFGDPLAGVGAGAIRVCKETTVNRVYINDLNPDAIELARKSAKLNRVYKKCSFSQFEATNFLSKHSGPRKRFDWVELDPFGTPSPFLESAIRACKIGGVVSITATDGAVLCGVYPRVCFRKYGGYSLNTEYCHEIAVRILHGGLAFAAMKLDLGIEPVFVHTTKHYSRAYAIVTSRAVPTFSKIGYILHCFSCNSRLINDEIETRCKECGKKARVAGPLWIGGLFNKKIIRDSIGNAPSKASKELLEAAIAEAGAPPTYYVIDKLCNLLGMAPPSLSKVIEELRRRGHVGVRTILNPKAVRTDADIRIMKEVIRSLG
jgi:tRNA (guanine26-N2/guanine27-N2)-dimethyltransferase